MQRAVLLLALVACANAQLFQQNYDYRGSLQYRGDTDVAFSGRLEIVPPTEFSQAIRFSNSYTQTIRPAMGQFVAVDPRFGNLNQNPVGTNELPYLIVAAVGEDSGLREGEIIVVSPVDASLPCFGLGVPLLLNSPVPSAPQFPVAGSPQGVPGARQCIVSESAIVVKLNFQASRNEAAPLGLDNFRYVRSDRTIFGPTVF